MGVADGIGVGTMRGGGPVGIVAGTGPVNVGSGGSSGGPLTGISTPAGTAP